MFQIVSTRFGATISDLQETPGLLSRNDLNNPLTAVSGILDFRMVGERDQLALLLRERYAGNRE